MATGGQHEKRGMQALEHAVECMRIFGCRDVMRKCGKDVPPGVTLLGMWLPALGSVMVTVDVVLQDRHPLPLSDIQSYYSRSNN